MVEMARDGFFRIASGNIGGFHIQSTENPIANALKKWIRKAEVDMFQGVESNLNWQAMPRHGRPEEWFRSENALRVSKAHNTHENHGRKQQGGAFQLVFGSMAARVTAVGKDPTGLGRWAWTKFCGRGGTTARIITVYVPCKSAESGQSTVIAQHRRYFRSQGIEECPRDRLLRDLETQLLQWRQDGERLIVYLDANENTTDGPFQRMLTGPGLQLRDAFHHRHNDPRWPQTATYMKGRSRSRHPIDGVFVTPDVPVDRCTWISVRKSIADHRFNLLEVNILALMGEDLKRIVRPQARRLSCAIPKAKASYTRLLERQAKRHKLVERHYTLGVSFEHGEATAAQKAQLEILDRQKKEIMAHSEKKCRKLRMGAVDFAPANREARAHKLIWQLTVKRKQGKKVNAAYVKRLAKQWGVVQPLSVSLQQAKWHLRNAEREYERLKASAPEDRQEFLRERAFNQSGDVSATQQKAAKRLLRVERQRQDARHLRSVLGRLRGSAITKVEVLEDGVYVEKTLQADVEAGIKEMCEDRFRLTESTPPMLEPLRSELGLLGKTDAAKQILAGTYVCPDGVDEHTRAFLATLKACSPEGSSKISVVFTKEDFQGFWKRCKERTSSSMSGLHYGHYKAAVESDYLSELHAIQLQLVARSGQPLERWQNSLACMLEKVQGVIVVDKLRAILLLEADFNAYNGILLAKRMIDRATDNDWIPKELYATRDHEAIEVALNRTLIMDYSRLRRISAAAMSVDAHTCYDRVAHSIGSIAAQRWDVDPVAIGVMLITIQCMLFFLRTGFGDSLSSFGRTGTPLQGLCQGNKGAPAMWLCVSSALVDMMHEQGHTTTLRTAMTAAVFVFIGFIFVDDTDLYTIAVSFHEPLGTLVRRSQRHVTAWQGGLIASGGACKPVKSMWGMTAFAWRDGQWHYWEYPANIYVQDPEGNAVAITRYDSKTAIKIVGVHLALDGNMRTQLQAMKAKAAEWGTKVKEGWVPRKLAYLGLNSTLWASLRYSLPATTLTDTQGGELSAGLFKQILPKLGTVRSFPNVYRYAPVGLQGLGLPQAKWEQEIEHIRRILTHGSSDTPTGFLLRATLEQAQLEVGFSRSFLDAPFNAYGPLLTDCWWKSVWEFIWKHDIKLRWGDQFLPEGQREGDSFIMEALVTAGVNGAVLVSCNRVRLAIQALTFADITTADGRWISDSARDGIKVHDSRWTWAKEQPCTTDLSRWRRSLQRISSSEYQFSVWDRLGKWIPRHTHKVWQWHYSPSTQCLFKDQGLWHRYRTPGGSRHGTFSRTEVGVIVPDDLCRAEVLEDPPNGIRLRGYQEAVPPENPTYASIRELFSSWKLHWPLDDSYFPEDPTFLIAAIQNGSALGCCDGSYQPLLSQEIAAASWKVEDPVSGVCMGGSVPCSGTTDEVGSYRAELQGFHALLLGLEAFCKFHDIRHGKVRSGFDNLLGTQRSRDARTRVPPTIAHSDLVRGIRVLRTNLPIDVSVEHVYGHQDLLVSYGDLPRLAQLNVQMDEAAKEKVQWMKDHNPNLQGCQEIRGEGWSVWVEGVKQTSDPGPAIRRSIAGRKLQTHLAVKRRLPVAAFHAVDWDAIDRATANSPYLFRLWMSKHVSGHFAVGKMMRRWGFWDHCRCPCCGADEDKVHLMSCPDEEAKLSWNSGVDVVEDWMDETATMPAIKQCLIRALRSRDPAHNFTANCPPTILTAGTAQQEIGWLNFTEGKVATQWRQLQQQYYEQQDIDKSARKWVQSLVLELLQLTHAQWLYRNSIQHERDRRGLLLKDAEDLNNEINSQFEQGTEGLHERDHHFILRGKDAVLQMSVTDQRNWVAGIQVARTVHEESVGREIAGMRAIMDHFLLRND